MPQTPCAATGRGGGRAGPTRDSTWSGAKSMSGRSRAHASTMRSTSSDEEPDADIRPVFRAATLWQARPGAHALIRLGVMAARRPLEPLGLGSNPGGGAPESAGARPFPRIRSLSMQNFPSIRFGADYNPEQWPEEVWDDDVRLMQGAQVTTATVGVFSWARLEPRPGEFDFGWLDRVLDKLHAGGIRVMMATATASPPAWLAVRHPETLPVDERGVRLGFGSRQQYSPNSAVYREHAARLAREVGFSLRRASGDRGVARQQRTRLPRRQLLRRRVGGCLPRLARASLRRHRGTQPGVGNRVLVAALRLVRRGRRAPGGTDLPQPDPASRLEAVRILVVARALPDGTRHPAGGRSGQADHHQLRGLPPVGRLLAVGIRARLHQRRRLPRPRRSHVVRDSGRAARPHARSRRRQTVAAHGAVAGRRQLARPERAQAARSASRAQPQRGRARCRRHPALSVAAVRAGAEKFHGAMVPARGRAHAPASGDRGARGRTGRAVDDGCLRSPGSRAGRDRLRLGVVVGDRAGGGADEHRLPRHGGRLVRRSAASRGHGRLRSRVGILRRLRPRAGAGAARRLARGTRRTRRGRRTRCGSWSSRTSRESSTGICTPTSAGISAARGRACSRPSGSRSKSSRRSVASRIGPARRRHRGRSTGRKTCRCGMPRSSRGSRAVRSAGGAAITRRGGAWYVGTQPDSCRFGCPDRPRARRGGHRRGLRRAGHRRRNRRTRRVAIHDQSHAGRAQHHRRRRRRSIFAAFGVDIRPA